MPRLQLSDTELESMRGRLAAAARDLYLDEGESAVTFRRIAERIGLSHTLPYRYFDDKEALLAQVRTECMAHFEAFIRARDPLAAGPPPPDRYPQLLAARQRLFDHVMGAVRGCIEAGLVQGDARVVTHTFWITMHGLLTLHVANQLVHGCNLQQLARSLLENLFGPAPANRRAPRARRRSAGQGRIARN
jgi:AcrR family transcriptional regulator